MTSNNPKMFQFTHPCGCDKLTVNLVRKIKSFNSRTRVGATAYSTVSPAGNVVSIHAPVWVRPRAGLTSQGKISFQFTHPCGCDLVRHPIATMQRVSIHAPVWVRHPIAAPIGFFVKFQFTHPCGCDFVFFWILLVSFGFNSRTRVGATDLPSLCSTYCKVSIHAPVWVRPGRVQKVESSRRFQFTHPCGCDLPVWRK